MNNVRILRGQVYHEVDRRPYVRKDGTRTELVVWESNCAECGSIFEFTTPAIFPAYVNRRCRKHRKRGIPVKPRSAA